jgi:hypothetical protein
MSESEQAVKKYRDATINSLVSGYKNRQEQDVSLIVKTYTADGKLNLATSQRIYTKAKNLPDILNKRMNELVQRGEKTYDSYTITDMISGGGGARYEGGERKEAVVRRDMLMGGVQPKVESPKGGIPKPTPVPGSAPKKVVGEEKVDLGPVPAMEKKMADRIFQTHQMFEKYQKTPNAKVTTTFTDKTTGAKFQERTTAKKAALSLQKRRQLEFILAIGWAGLSLLRRKMIAKRYGKLGKWMLEQAKKKQGRRR